MSKYDLVPRSGEGLEPAREHPVSAQMQRRSMAGAMTPWDQFKLDRKLRREHTRLITELAELERETIVAEQVVRSRTRIADTTERSTAARTKLQLDCLGAAGRELDGTLVEAGSLGEDARALVQGAALGVFSSYARGVQRRAARAL